MNIPRSYDFKAIRRRNGLLITGHVLGPRPGVPCLRPEASPTPEVRVYRLTFQPATQADSSGVDYLEPKPSPEWRIIRILLPDAQEFVIHARRAP